MILAFRNLGVKRAWTWQELYGVAGVTRQAVSKYETRVQMKLHDVSFLLDLVHQERAVNKRMGLKKIYQKRRDFIPVGRDQFIRIMVSYGMGIKRKKAYHITTKSLKDRYFPNLIKGLRLNDKNQVWQSDITYFSYNKQHLYLILIIDVYTRFIVGYHFDDNMKSDSVICALQMALANEDISPDNDLIHHSDRGSQYGSKEYVATLKAHNIDISMCQQAYENAYAERLNQTIKQEYLKGLTLDTRKPLSDQIIQQIQHYNHERPHWNLPDTMSPFAFKNYIETIPKENRAVMTLYTEVTDPQCTGPEALSCNRAAPTTLPDMTIIQ